MDLEEGEISSSDEEKSKDLPCESFDYQELERPTLPTRSLVSESQHTEYQYQEDEDENSDVVSNSSSDDDEYYGPSRPKLRTKQRSSETSGTWTNFMNPNMRSGITQPVESSKYPSGSDTSFEGMARNYQTKRKNNIWSDVLKEQTIGSAADELGMFVVGDDVQRIQRGSESFVIEHSLKRKYVKEEEDSGVQLENADSNESFSSSGLSDDSKDYLNSNSPDMEVTEEKVVKARKDRTSLKDKILNATSSLTDEKLCSFVARRLQERKSYLIFNILKYLGRDVVVHLFTKTLLIEKRGGILIKNGARRRTPGGVFLYLLRGSKKYANDIVQKIFDEEREHEYPMQMQQGGSALQIT